MLRGLRRPDAGWLRRQPHAYPLAIRQGTSLNRQLVRSICSGQCSVLRLFGGTMQTSSLRWPRLVIRPGRRAITTFSRMSWVCWPATDRSQPELIRRDRWRLAPALRQGYSVIPGRCVIASRHEVARHGDIVVRPGRSAALGHDRLGPARSIEPERDGLFRFEDDIAAGLCGSRLDEEDQSGQQSRPDTHDRPPCRREGDPISRQSSSARAYSAACVASASSASRSLCWRVHMSA